MTKKEKWREVPELPEGTGMLQVKMPPSLQEIIELDDPKYVWIILFYKSGGIEHHVFRVGMHPLVMTAALAKETRLHVEGSKVRGRWVVSDSKGRPIAALMRQEILSIEGVADYDRTFGRPH